MEPIFQHAWVLFIASTCVNAAVWWFRGRHARDARPELRDSYVALIKGFLFWANLPWFVLGLFVLTGALRSTFEIMDLRSGNRYVQSWVALVVLLWLLCTRWLFSGGAQLLVDHPGLLNLNNPTPHKIKLLWLACLAGGVAGFLMLYLNLPSRAA